MTTVSPHKTAITYYISHSLFVSKKCRYILGSGVIYVSIFIFF